MGLPCSRAKKKARLARTVNEGVWKKIRSEAGRVILYGFLQTITKRSFDLYFVVK